MSGDNCNHICSCGVSHRHEESELNNQVAEAGSLGPAGAELYAKPRDRGSQPIEDETPVDKLGDMFARQEEFMQLLKQADKLPEWPIDITSKYGQRQIKEIVWNMVEEMAEASFILKNRQHRFTDHQEVDFGHFKEELGDALAYFMEICIMSGISAAELYEEYCRKNALVKKRAREGY